MVKIICDSTGDVSEEVIVEDASTPDEFEDLAKRIGSAIPNVKIIRSKVSPVIGVHTGPRVMVAGAISTA